MRFSALRALPSTVLGPVDFFALRRLAAICFFVAMGFLLCGGKEIVRRGRRRRRRKTRAGTGEHSRNMVTYVYLFFNEERRPVAPNFLQNPVGVGLPACLGPLHRREDLRARLIWTPPQKGGQGRPPYRSLGWWGGPLCPPAASANSKIPGQSLRQAQGGDARASAHPWQRAGVSGRPLWTEPIPNGDSFFLPVGSRPRWCVH
jgi:hypothetical protein